MTDYLKAAGLREKACVEKLAQLPNEIFTLIKVASNGHGHAPRLGKLALPGRNSIETPHYLGITSRGAVPHLSQDNFLRETGISGVYVGLEDCKSTYTPPRPRTLHSAAWLTRLAHSRVSYRALSFASPSSLQVPAAGRLISFAPFHCSLSVVFDVTR